MKKQTNFWIHSTGSGKGATSAMQEDDMVTGGFTPPRQKVFTTADLWNIQRQRRTVIHSGYLL